MSYLYTNMPYIDRAFADDKHPKGGFRDGSLYFIGRDSNLNAKQTVYAMIDRFLQQRDVLLIDGLLAFSPDELSPFGEWPDYSHSLQVLRGSYWFGGHEDILTEVGATSAEAVLIYGYDEGKQEPVPQFAEWFQKLEAEARSNDLPIIMFQKGMDAGAVLPGVSWAPARLKYRNAKY